jgi:hypothetical protein
LRAARALWLALIRNPVIVPSVLVAVLLLVVVVAETVVGSTP